MADEPRDERPDWVKQVQDDAERITTRRLQEAHDEADRLAETEQSLYTKHPAPAEQRLNKNVVVAERTEAVTQPVTADAAVNAESVKELKKKV